MDEHHYDESDATMLYIEEARARAERASAALRKAGAETHLIEAVEDARQELSDAQRRLLQRSHFAVPSAQTSL